MATLTLLFYLVAVGSLANAGVVEGPDDTSVRRIPRCSTECSITEYTLLHYMQDGTYFYTYSGKSSISMGDLPDGVSPSTWYAEVGFTWLSPCDVAITFKDVTVDGKTDIPDAKVLHTYPMVLAVDDGHVRHVCTHPDDEAWSINWKKGVASIFQISLPTRSAVSSGMEFIEEDVVGRCPTKYEVQKVENAITVRKEKNHHRCDHRYPTPFQAFAPWLKFSVPLKESKSVCTQELINGLFRTISCKDTNIIRPSFGAYKYIEAHQESTLQYRALLPEIPEPVAHHTGPMYKRDLLLEYGPPRKDVLLVPQLEKVIKEICVKTQTSIEDDSAVLMAKVLHFLRRIPEKSIEATLKKITDGEICSNYERLESLYLDAIAFVHEPSAVGIMVKSLVSGSATEGRAALYSSALHLTRSTDIRTIEALKPLFETSKTLALEKLAAGSIVHSYCKRNPQCKEESPVIQLAEAAAAQVQKYCKASGDEESDQRAIASLKALGNMGVMSSEASMSVIKCIAADEVRNNVRVAAAQSFRNAECRKQVTKHLVTVTTDQDADTEVRIATYLAAVRCAEQEDLGEIISKISMEENTQVRSFILSHLLNLQESSDLYKERLRYFLSDYILPVNITADFRKYSRNYQMSYYNQPLGLGAGYQSDVVFSPGSYLPRSVNMNLTAILGKIPFNLGEMGTRIEGFEPIVSKLLGPTGFLRRSSLSKFLNDFINAVKDEEGGLFLSLKREKSSFNTSTVSDFLKKVYRKEKGGQKADMYVRLSGQEMFYGSWAGDLEETDIRNLADSFIDFVIESLIRLSDMTINSARTGQLKMDYSLSTIQGIPLKLELEGTAVIGFKASSELSIISEESISVTQVLPSLSLQVNGFAGFDSHLIRNGIKMENLVSSDNGLRVKSKVDNKKQLQFDISLPEVMNILGIKSETYLMKEIASQKETKIIPTSVRDVRFKENSCISKLQSVFGLQLCYDFDVPNIFQSTGLPLGGLSTFRIFAKKTDVSMRGFSFKTSIHNDGGIKMIKLNAEAQGSSIPRKLESILQYELTPESHTVSASIEYPNVQGHILVNLIQREQFKAVEVLGKWHSNGMQRLGSFKTDIKTRLNPTDKEIDLDVYASNSHHFSPDTLIFEVKFKEKISGLQRSLDFIAQTMGYLRHSLTFTFEAGLDFKYIGELRILVPQRLRKFEVEGKVGSIALVTSIKKESDSRYISLLKILQRELELISFTANHDIIFDDEHELEIKTSAEGLIRDASYKIAANIARGNLKKGFMLVIVQKADNMKIVDVDIMHENRPEILNTKILVDFPEYINVIKIENKLVKQEGDRYMLDTAFTHGRQTMLHVTGPVTMIFTAFYSLKFQADLRIVTLSSRPITVSSIVELSSKRNLLKLMTKNEEELFFSYEWLIQVERSKQWTVRMGTAIPLLANCEIDIRIKENALLLKMDTLILPKIAPSRRIKAVVDMNFENMEMRTDLAWDAEQDPSKKLTANLRVTHRPADTNRFSLGGNVIYKSKTYRLLFDTSGLDQSSWRREAMCQITMPTGETVKFDANLAIERKALYTQFIGQILYKDLRNQLYQFSEKLYWGNNYSQEGFRVISKSRYESPSKQEATLDIETNYRHTDSERLFVFQTKTTSPSLHLPLGVELKVDNKVNNHRTIFVACSDTPLNILEYELEFLVHRGVKRIVLDFDMSSAVELIEIIQRLTNLNPETRLDSIATLPRSHGFRIDYSRPSAHKHSLVLKSPSRAMKGDVEYSPFEYGLTFYPNEERSDSKYEISAAFRREGEIAHGDVIGVLGRVRHPSLTRDLTVSLQHSRVGYGTLGTIEIDIFQNEADKLTGNYSCHAQTPESFWIDATLKMQAIKTNPHFFATIGYTQDIFSFSFMGTESVSESPWINFGGRLDRSNDGVGAFGFSSDVDSQSLLEFSGSFTPEEGPHCYGTGLHSFIHIMQSEYYELRSKICIPAFIEISANKHKKLDVLKTRVGYSNPNTAEMSLLMEDKDTLQTTPITMAKVTLVSDTLINVELAKDTEKLSWAKNLVHGEWEKISSAIDFATSKIAEKLKKVARLPTFQFPPSEFSALAERLRNDLREIGEDISRDARENHFLIYLEPKLKILWTYLQRVERSFSSTLDRIDAAFQENFKGLFDFLIQISVKILEMLEEGESSQIIQWFIDFTEDIPEIRELRQLLEDLMKKYPADVKVLKNVVAKIIGKLEEDIDDIRDAISHTPALQKDINWFFKNYNRVLGLQMNKFISKILHNLLILSVQSDENHLMISVPMSRPITSLTQALQYALPKPTTLVRDAAWRLYSFYPKPLKYLLWDSHTLLDKRFINVLPPYNRTAVIVNGKELLTFDGVVLRAPTSPCKVLLLSFKNNYLFMEHPETDAPQQLTLNTSEAVVIIKPNYEISLNGHEILSNNITESGISVSKTMDKIIVSVPFMIVEVYTKDNVVSLIISGWVFGETAGLLGTYDGEVGNDRLMSNGTRASNLQELVRSWQEDQHCPTPSISPVNPAHVSDWEDIQCHIYLEVPNQCSSIIDPDPFVKICYASGNPYHALKAYHAMCNSKHIGLVFPDL